MVPCHSFSLGWGYSYKFDFVCFLFNSYIFIHRPLPLVIVSHQVLDILAYLIFLFNFISCFSPASPSCHSLSSGFGEGHFQSNHSWLLNLINNKEEPKVRRKGRIETSVFFCYWLIFWYFFDMFWLPPGSSQSRIGIVQSVGANITFHTSAIPNFFFSETNRRLDLILKCQIRSTSFWDRRYGLMSMTMVIFGKASRVGDQLFWDRFVWIWECNGNFWKRVG